MLIFSPLRHLLNNLGKLFLEVCVSNRKIRRILKGEMAKFYLKKYVKRAIKYSKSEEISSVEPNDYTIWQFWDSGVENAPEIVKRCIESVDKFEPNKKHVILDMNNIADYVKIPEKYYELLKSGKMGMAHFSDILRTYLLVKYGGCWIDATVLLTDKLPDYITNSDLFLFQNYAEDDLDGLNIASYFIYSRPNNKILNALKQLLFEYWSDNDFLMNYFMYLHAFTMLVLTDSILKAEWSKVPFASFIPVQHFQRELLNKYSDSRWSQLKSTTGIHKITHKTKIIGLDKNTDISDTFYERLIKEELV